MYFIHNGERVTGDLTTNDVVIPYAVLTQWSASELAAYGVTRFDDALAPGTQPPGATVVPETITNFQARAALIELGLFDAVDGWAKELGVNHPGFQAWEYGNDFYRHGALLTGMAAQFGMGEDMLDQIFVRGAQILA